MEKSLKVWYLSSALIILFVCIYNQYLCVKMTDFYKGSIPLINEYNEIIYLLTTDLPDEEWATYEARELEL